MPRGFQVKEMTTGVVYANMSAAEKALGLPGGTVSDAVKRNYRTHGYVFKLVPKDGSESTEPKIVHKYVLSFEPEEFESLEENYEGISVRSAVIKLHKDGFTCDSYEGKLTVYNIKDDKSRQRLRNLLLEYGYQRPVVITPYSDNRYKYFREFRR